MRIGDGWIRWLELEEVVSIEGVLGVLVDEELDGGFGEDLEDVEAITDEEVSESPSVRSRVGRMMTLRVFVIDGFERVDEIGD